MFAILVAEIALVTIACINHSDLRGTLKTGFERTLDKYDANKEAWNFVQKEVRVGNNVYFFSLFPPYFEKKMLLCKSIVG